MKNNRMKSKKRRIFEIIQIGNRSDVVSTGFDSFIVVVILINIAITFMQTFERLNPIADVLKLLELITIIIFLVEYCLRIWTADELYPELKPGRAVLRFVFSFYGMIDLLTILPYFLPFFLPSGAVAFRMLRVVRIMRLFRVNSNYDAFNVITAVLKEKKDQLVSSIFLIIIMLMASSLCMYGLEHDAQPENFANAFSGVWWSVSTLLTVGYGDIYPITVGGRIMAIVIAFLGVGMVAIPTGIISAGFVEYYTKIKTGTYSQQDAAFITLHLNEGHSYAGKPLKEINIPEGLFPAVILRGEDVFTPYPNLELMVGDRVLLGTVENSPSDCRLEEVYLEPRHPWIGARLKDLDISRRDFVVMIKRKNRNIRPQGDTVLKEQDIVFILNKKTIEKKA